MCAYLLSHFICVQLFVTLWTVAHQTPLSMGFSRQDTGVDCCALLQWIFPTQRLNPFSHPQGSLAEAPPGMPRTTIWPWNPTPRQIPEENHNLKIRLHPNVHCSTIYNNLDMEATQMSINREKWIKKMVHVYNGLFFSHKKEQNNAFCSNIDGLRLSYWVN